MTGPLLAVDAPTAAAPARAERALLAATAVFLFVAASASSAGLRTGLLLIALAALALSRRSLLFADLRDVPRAVAVFGLAWCALALASVAWSIEPRLSLGEVRSEVGYGLLAFVVFFAAARHLGRWRPWWIAIIAGTLAVAALQLVQDFARLRLSRHPLDGGPGPWSTHLVLVAPLLLAIVWPRPWGFARGNLVKIAALALLLVSAAFTGNRIVWAAFAAQLAVLLLIAGSMPAMERDRVAMLRRIALMASLALALGFAASVLERNVRHFRFDPSVTASIDHDIRPRLWRAAADAAAKAPWLGHGFGREILAKEFLPLTPKAGNHPPMRHAHNAFVDAALQLGLTGLAILVALFAALAREYARFLRDPRLAPWGVIGLAMLAGYMVKNLTDDFFYRHNALVFWALNGLLLGLAAAVRRRGEGEAAS